MDDDWPYFPVILGQGSLYELRDGEYSPPRLSGMKSVSPAAAEALRRTPKPTVSRPIGFYIKGRK